MFGNSTHYGSCIIPHQPIFCRRCILHFVVFILQILYTKFFSIYSADCASSGSLHSEESLHSVFQPIFCRLCFLNSVVYIPKKLYIFSAYILQTVRPQLVYILKNLYILFFNIYSPDCASSGSLHSEESLNFVFQPIFCKLCVLRQSTF